MLDGLIQNYMIFCIDPEQGEDILGNIDARPLIFNLNHIVAIVCRGSIASGHSLLQQRGDPYHSLELQMPMKFSISMAAILLCILIQPFAYGSNRELLKIGRNDGSSIHYYLEKAADSNVSDVLLVVLQGSDCNSVIYSSFIHEIIRNVWSTADLLLVEKYGITAGLPHKSDMERTDCPTAYIKHDNPTQRVKDLYTVLMRVNADRHYETIVVLGGSEGATVAVMLASTTKFPDATVVINGGGRWFLDDVLYDIKHRSLPASVIEDTESFKQFSQQILAGGPFKVQMSNHGYGWWHEMLEIDQQTLLSRISSPVLIVQGAKDTAVSPVAVNQMVENLLRQGKKNIDYLIYHHLNHELLAPDGRNEAERVMADINVWLHSIIEEGVYKSIPPAARTTPE